MDTDTAARQLDALASPVRLAVFRRLVRAGRAGLVAGDIGTALDLPPSKLSFHLKTLLHAGLVTVDQEGRFLRYRAALDTMQTLMAFLTEACCADTPDTCSLATCPPGCTDPTEPPA